MADLTTMLWKEFSEFLANRRSLRIFGFAVLIMGLIPIFVAGHARSRLPGWFLLLYVLFAAVITTGNVGTDSVLRERAAKTLEPLLATRLPDRVLFGGKVLSTVAIAYASSLATIAVQEIALNLSGNVHRVVGFQTGPEAALYLIAPLLLAGYLSTIAVFIGLRVGDQRSAYLLTTVSVLVLGLPFMLHLVHFHATLPWIRGAMIVLAILDVLLIRVGVLLFRRERLVLYLQD